jgi:hypothetical protein
MSKTTRTDSEVDAIASVLLILLAVTFMVVLVSGQ